MKANLGTMTRTTLASLTPLQQLRAGRTTRRLVQLAVGLTLYGVSMGMMVRSGSGSTRGTSSTTGSPSTCRSASAP